MPSAACVYSTPMYLTRSVCKNTKRVVLRSGVSSAPSAASSMAHATQYHDLITVVTTAMRNALFTQVGELYIYLTMHGKCAGHKHHHCLLYEVVSFPDGLVGRAFGPSAGANNDRNAVEEGGCRDMVRDHFHGYALYGGGIYHGYEPEVS